MMFGKVTYMCPDHPRNTTPTKVIMWGGIPDVVNHAMFRQNWLKVSAPRGGGSKYLFLTHRCCLYNRLGLSPTYENDIIISSLSHHRHQSEAT